MNAQITVLRNMPKCNICSSPAVMATYTLTVLYSACLDERGEVDYGTVEEGEVLNEIKLLHYCGNCFEREA